jgi:hypothetical protein
MTRRAASDRHRPHGPRASTTLHRARPRHPESIAAVEAAGGGLAPVGDRERLGCVPDPLCGARDSELAHQLHRVEVVTVLGDLAVDNLEEDGVA